MERLNSRPGMIRARGTIFTFQFFQRDHRIDPATRELDVPDEYDASTDRHFAGQVLDCMDACRQRRQGILEREAAILVQDCPIVHLCTRENDTICVAQVQYQQAFRRQEQMIEEDLSIHAIGNHKISEVMSSDSADDAFRMSTPTSPEYDAGPGHEGAKDCDRDGDG